MLLTRSPENLLCSVIEPEMPSNENSETDENSEDHGWTKGCTNVSVKDEFKAICGICGKRDHKSYESPFSWNRKICYLACDTFLGMSPLERRKILDDKGFCLQCLTANAKKGHEHCHNTYICRHPSHDPNSERCHVLVCEEHRDTTDNDKILKKFKKEFIRKFEKDLPYVSANIKI